MVQNLQPVGTVEWSDNAGDPYFTSEELNGVLHEENEEMNSPFVVSVLFGGDRIVYPDEDGDWTFLAQFEEDESYFYDRTDEFARESDEYFVVDIAGADGRFLFVENEE
jgi:hypothetical protein